MAKPKTCVITAGGTVACGTPVAPKKRIEARDRKSGRIAHSTGTCVCGHPFDWHVAGGHECICHEVGDASIPEDFFCPCEKYRKARAAK